MRAVIIANGMIHSPPEALAALLPGDLLIAADGGAHHFKSLCIVPDVVVGDLDSLSESLRRELESHGTLFVAYPRNKANIDLELALAYAVDRGVDEILLMGISGGRLDQTLANLLVLTREDWREVRLVAVEGPDRVYLLRAGEELDLHGEPGEIVSLLPITLLVEGVSTRGLRWPLENGILEFGGTLSISNEMAGSHANIKITAGQLFVIHRMKGN